MKITRKSFQSFFTRASFAGLLLVGATVAHAQTNGTLTGVATTYNYSTAPWVITGVPGPYPDGGGTATFGPITGAVPGTLGALSTVTFDVSPTLSSIVFNTPIQYVLATGAGQSIVGSTAGLTINAQSTAQNILTNGLPSSVAFGSQITGVISGGGSAGLTKTGVGNVYINAAAANTYTGGTHFNAGFTIVGATAAVGDSVFGATGAGNGLSFNGGSALFAVTGGLTSARDIFLDTNGGTLLANTATTFTGVVSGSGTLTNLGFGGVALTLSGINTYTGATISRGTNANLALSGAGTILTSPSYDLQGTFSINNTTTNVADRVADAAPVTIRGLNFVSTGNATANSSETIGSVTATGALNRFVVTPGTGAGNSLTMGRLTRQNNATFSFRGTGLGSAPGAGVSNVYITAAPTLVGGGGGGGSTSISIIPYATGSTSGVTTFAAADQVGTSFVTYDANGVRPLATTEYATTFGVSTDNVRLTAATAAPVATVNSLLFAPAAAATLSGGPISITSGAFLYSPTTNVTGTVSAGLDFGTAEGIISNTSLLTVSGLITGSNGLTLNALYAPTNNYTPNLSLTGANTYTGNTVINGGAIGFSGTVAAATNGAFGTSGSAITLNGGAVLASLVPTATTVFNRDINSTGNGSNYISPSSSGFTSVFNGNVSLSNGLILEGFSNAATSSLTFNGVISGAGTLSDIGFTYLILNGNNTYTGGTVLGGTSASSYFAGSDTAFGTGAVTFNNTSTAGSSIAGVGTTARTIANALVLNATSGFGGAAPLTFTGAVNLQGARTMTVSNTALTTFSGQVSNGGITKGGTGAVAFNNATGNTFTGGFLNTGVAATSSAIYANNTSGSAFGTGAVSIGANSATVFSTLAGNFTTSGATSIGGRLSPGYTPLNLTAATAGQGVIGTEAFNNTLTLSSGTTSSLYLEAASNVSRDQIVVGGAFTLAGTVNIVTISGYVFQPGDVVDFVDWGSITVGTYTLNTTGAAVASGYALDTSLFTTDGTIRVIAVPEPGTWAAVVGGLGMLGTMQFARRRRNRGA